MLFLKEFWRGNLSPGDERYHPQREYKEIWSLVEKMEEQLKEQLSPEQWELFTKYQDAERGASCVSDEDTFIDGFRMGARVILDVLLKTA